MWLCACVVWSTPNLSRLYSGLSPDPAQHYTEVNRRWINGFQWFISNFINSAELTNLIANPHQLMSQLCFRLTKLTELSTFWPAYAPRFLCNVLRNPPPPLLIVALFCTLKFAVPLPALRFPPMHKQGEGAPRTEWYCQRCLKPRRLKKTVSLTRVLDYTVLILPGRCNMMMGGSVFISDILSK